MYKYLDSTHLFLILKLTVTDSQNFLFDLEENSVLQIHTVYQWNQNLVEIACKAKIMTTSGKKVINTVTLVFLIFLSLTCKYFDDKCIRSYLLQVIVQKSIHSHHKLFTVPFHVRNCQQITFVTLKRFCLLSNPPSCS